MADVNVKSISVPRISRNKRIYQGNTAISTAISQTGGGAAIDWAVVTDDLVTINRDLHVQGQISASEEVIAWIASAVESDVLANLTATAPLRKSTDSNVVLDYDDTQFEVVGGDLKIRDDFAGGGSVTSVGLSAPTGFSVSGSPITGAGTLGLSFAAGYSLPTTVKQGQWDTAYGWGDHAAAGYQPLITGGATTITGTNLTANRALISNASGKVAVSAVTATELGYLDGVTSAIQTQLNGKQAALVSGTNIKTVNSNSLLGPGNISIAPMVYPGAGIPVSTGSAWGTSITNNSSNWNTAYTDRLKWDGGATGLNAGTGRTSLGGSTIGQSVFTSANPSAIRFLRANADNTSSWLDASAFRTAIGAGTSSLSLGETSSTAYRGDRGKIAYDHSQLTTGNPHQTGIDDLTDASNVAKLDASSHAFTGSGNHTFAGNFGVKNPSPTYIVDIGTPNTENSQDIIRMMPNNGPPAGDGLGYGSGLIIKALLGSYTKRTSGILQTAEGNYFRGGLAFFTNNTADATTDWVESMRLNRFGNLLVKTTTDSGDAVNVNGNIQATTAKLTSLSDGYLPYHVSDASGLANSIVSQSGSTLNVAGSIVATGLIRTNSKYELRNSSGVLKWSFELSGDDLLFKNASGATRGKMDQSGNFVAVGEVTAYGTV